MQVAVRSKERVRTAGEVFTPDFLVERMLDLFPEGAWSRKARWLEPSAGNGQFILAILRRKLARGFRLTTALKTTFGYDIMDDNIFDCHKRIQDEIILPYFRKHKVYGSKKTRSLNKAQSIIQANIRLTIDALSEPFDFDVIVGNPPYQQADRGAGASAGTLYPAFVLRAVEAKPAYLSMVIPARWMAGHGKGRSARALLDIMLSKPGLATVITTHRAKDWFPDVSIEGGAMYFLWQRDKTNSRIEINGALSDIAGQDHISIDPIGAAITKKVLTKCDITFDKVMFGRNAYGIPTNYGDWVDESESAYPCHCSGGAGRGAVVRFVAKNTVSRNLPSIDTWRVCIASAYGAAGTGDAFIIAPGAITTDSYLVLACLDTEEKAKNVKAYIQTPIAQFLVCQLKQTQHMPRKVFQYLPYLNWESKYTNAKLCRMFRLTKEETRHIGSSKIAPSFPDAM
jgi:hypothetical protein